MDTPDATHSALMQAMSNLAAASTAIDDGKWAANVLTMLLAANEVGAVESTLAFIKGNSIRIKSIASRAELGNDAISQALTAIGLARSKIHDTSPPDPRGFE